MENNQPPTHAKLFYAAQGILLGKNYVINRVLKWFGGFIDLEQHTGRNKKLCEHWKLTGCPHIWLHIAQEVRITPVLTSCEDLATALTVVCLQHIHHVLCLPTWCTYIFCQWVESVHFYKCGHNLQKPDIMAHTEISSIKNYKNLVQKYIS